MKCLAILAGLCLVAANARGADDPPSRCPSIPPRHKHARMLFDNALRYVAPANQIVDPASGYPFEGWNHDPKRGLFLRAFTQLTAIGQYMELLASVAAGQVETPHLSRDDATRGLARLVATLRADQRDPTLSAKGLLSNFLDLAAGRRIGPLAGDVDRAPFVAAFGPEKAEALWKALQAADWITPRNKGREAEIRRGARFGSEYFDGPLKPFADAATKTKVLEVLDRRVVMAIFGDNSNLSASVAKTIGALLTPEIKDRPEVAAIRLELEAFLEAQAPGYAHLYDPKAGLFYFGYDATRERMFGWEDPKEEWASGHMDYLINEFRGPATFVATRFGLPMDAIANLGFKMKAGRGLDGGPRYVLAPWEGSAFQGLGLTLSLGEPDRPGWRGLLRDFVEVETAYDTLGKLPGFLSESYTGEGSQYTGSVGIPEITVSPKPRITTAASLYTLGVAYSVEPETVEAFLAGRWAVLSTLLTDHGPWEGYNVALGRPIEFQTTAHTLSLVLGLIGQTSANMARYLDSRGDSARLAGFFRVAEKPVDLLDEGVNAFAWSPKGDLLKSGRAGGGGFRVEGEKVEEFGVAFLPPGPDGVDLSGGVLTLRYRSGAAAGPALIQLKPKGRDPSAPGLIAKEIFINLAATAGKDEEIRVPLPAMPGLFRVGEVVIARGPDPKKPPVDLTITRIGFEPASR